MKPLRLSILSERWNSPTSSPLALALEQAKIRGDILDLIGASPITHGFGLEQNELRKIAQVSLQAENVTSYRPDPSGWPPARKAIAAYYQRRAVQSDTERIVITPGTSMGYLYALKLLANPGEDVLIPRPGYPLFDDLFALCGVQPRYYHLREKDGKWSLDLDDIKFQITPRTRAIVVVSPHNPTGCVTDLEDFQHLGTICRKNGIALLLDEVFTHTIEQVAAHHPLDDDFPLIITLNGFSKMFCLPQWKLAWMRFGGTQELGPIINAVEHLSDTFLPVNELVQAMVPEVFHLGDPAVLTGDAVEYSRRRSHFAVMLRIPDPGAGTYLCLKLPEGMNDEKTCIRLLREEGLSVHPGYYYDMPGYLVMNCFADDEVLCRAAEILNRVIARA